MNKIDWKKKLTSRKFWVSIASFVTMIATAAGAGEDVTVQITALIMAGASVIAYIIGEGLADSKDVYIEQAPTEGTDDESVGE